MKEMKKKRKASKKKKVIPIKREETSLENTFFATFIGEYVEVICSRGISYNNNTVPVSTSGFLLDVDDEFYYLSQDGQSVSSAVKKVDVTVMEIINQQSFATQVLEEVKIPENREDGN
jgi:hypothetical protein